jgi:phosphate transport system substrate-binding protein
LEDHRVTISTPKRLGALVLAASFVAAACSGGGASSAPSSAASDAPPPSDAASVAPSAAAVEGTVAVDGSSTVYPITAAVAEEFAAAQPGVDVSVAESGTGGGFKKFCVGETDINDASRPIKKDDEAEGKACEANGVTYVQLQVGIDGLTVVVNPENTWVTCLTLDQLKTIYGPDSPENLTWNQVDPSFPNQPVVRYMPGADSGTFDYFTEVVNGETDASTAFATQSEDDNVLVTGVAGDVNAISYFGYAYYAENTDKLKAVEIDGGSGCVAPTDETIGDNSYAPLSRPLFIYPNTAKAVENAALYEFVNFYLANAATLAAEVGYVAVPEAVATQQLDNWNSAVPK